MSKRSIIVPVAVIAVALILVVTVPPLLSSPSQIAAKAAGTWQENDGTPSSGMQVTTAGSTYLVTYPRWHFFREAFVLRGDKLVGGGGENSMNDTVKAVTYDNSSGQLTISDQSGHSYTFTRVTRPSGVRGVMREVGGPLPGSRPHANTVIEVRWGSADGPMVAGTISGARGAFKVTVPPGDYWVVPIAKGDEQVVPDHVTVHPVATCLPSRSSR